MKKWYLSKTLWVNVIALAASLLSEVAGVEVDAQTQVSLLVVVNLILRLVTKTELTW